MNILLTGSQGYIGSGITRHLRDLYKITCINRNIFDLRDSEETKQWFSNLNICFDVVIHTAIKGGNRIEKDASSILDDNIKMYLNLLNHRDRYKKFINIGSGAELSSPDSFYGLSKKTIAQSILDKTNFYNLRIYGIFDEYELDRRLIKHSISNYLENKDIIIHDNKYMDFIYFYDFISILKEYIESKITIKTIDCVYEDKYMLTDIANIINQSENYSVPIKVENNSNNNYIGNYYNFGINYIGLKQGIQKTYRKIKYEKSLVCSK
jgi:nucleoside-diphosphate-sugar epimerase